jgi:hypothetical protein
LNGTIPALVNSRVGSFFGTSESHRVAAFREKVQKSFAYLVAGHKAPDYILIVPRIYTVFPVWIQPFEDEREIIHRRTQINTDESQNVILRGAKNRALKLPAQVLRLGDAGA